MIDSVAEAKEKLTALVQARASDSGFLSATLSTSRLDDWRQFAPAFLRSEFNRITQEQELSKARRRVLQADLDYVLDVVQYDITPSTQGLAVYVDSAAGIHERIELPLRLVNRLVIESSPHVRPVVHALSLLEPFVIARVSRDESSLYLVDEWGVKAEDDLAGPWLRSSDRATGETSIKEYYAAARQDALVDHHFKEVASALGRLLETTGAPRLVVCAQHEIARGFRRAAPTAIVANIVAEIAYDAAASTAQMVANAREAVRRARHEELVALADRIKEGLGPGGRGVAGFDDVQTAVGRHQVQTVLVDRDYQVPGYRCGRCEWLSLTPGKCALCGGDTTPLADAVAEVVRLAILQNGQVEVGERISALADMGGVAGLLRYA